MAGATYYREVICVSSSYTDCVSTDKGKTVTGGTTGDTGTLLEYDNTSRKWIIEPDATTDEFDEAEALTIGSGTGAGTTEAASSKFWYFSRPIDVEDEIIRDHSQYRDHHKAAVDLIDRMRKRGYTDDDIEDDLLTTSDMRDFCTYLANFFTCFRNYKNKNDVWYEKMVKYKEMADMCSKSLEIALEGDSDDVIDDDERLNLQNRIVR